MPKSETARRKTERWILPTYARFDVTIAAGKGACFWDTDGKRYLDFTSGIGVNALGTADPEWLAAICAQAGKLAHCSNLFYSPAQAELAERLCRATGFSGVFFCNSGAEANEALIKLARKYSCDRRGPGRPVIVTLENSFHGRTVTTLSATGQDAFHRYFAPFTEGFRFTPPNDLDAMDRALADDVCAVLLEPIQGEGGVVPLSPEFVRGVAKLAASRGILLLFDEVQTGVGRTGTFFAYEQFGVKADAVSSAKALAGGLPMGALLVGEKCRNVFGPGDHGSTFGGNPIACAGAGVVVKRLTKPGFLDAVACKGAYLREQLSGMPGVKNVRGAGLMIGFDPVGVSASDAAKELLHRGLCVLTAKQSLRLLPPLVVTREEIDEGLSILRRFFEQAAGN